MRSERTSIYSDWAQPRTLQRGSVDIWMVHEEAPVPDKLLIRYESMLADTECAKWKAFHFATDRRRYLLTRALQRSVLSLYVPQVAPDQWQFAAQESGKPFIARPTDLPQRIEFSITHTSGLVAMAVSCGDPIGIDAENMARGPALEIADELLHSRERMQLELLDPPQRWPRLLALWTLKEARAKALGIGLGDDFKAVCFEFASTDPLSDFAYRNQANDCRWQYALLELPGKLILAVALSCASHRAAVLNSYAGVPLLTASATAPLRVFGTH